MEFPNLKWDKAQLSLNVLIIASYVKLDILKTCYIVKLENIEPQLDFTFKTIRVADCYMVILF